MRRFAGRARRDVGVHHRRGLRDADVDEMGDASPASPRATLARIDARSTRSNSCGLRRIGMRRADEMHERRAARDRVARSVAASSASPVDRGRARGHARPATRARERARPRCPRRSERGDQRVPDVPGAAGDENVHRCGSSSGSRSSIRRSAAFSDASFAIAHADAHAHPRRCHRFARFAAHRARERRAGVPEQAGSRARGCRRRACRRATLHPAFYGSFDWHSCVHMHWLLVRVRRLHPALPRARARSTRILDRHFDAARDRRASVAYLQRPEAASFERTYGWAWLLELAARAARSRAMPRRGAGAAALAPLADAFVVALARLPAARRLSVALRRALRTARSASRSRSTTRVARGCRARVATRVAKRARDGSATIATRRRRGSRRAPISCRRRSWKRT